MGRTMSRRQFVAAAIATGTAAALPLDLVRVARAATPAASSSKSATFYYFTQAERDACEALCSRIVPSTEPVTAAPAPGAVEAGAVVFIDRFLAAFTLPATVADNPAIYLHGRLSGRANQAGAGTLMGRPSICGRVEPRWIRAPAIDHDYGLGLGR